MGVLIHDVAFALSPHCETVVAALDACLAKIRESVEAGGNSDEFRKLSVVLARNLKSHPHTFADSPFNAHGRPHAPNSSNLTR